jgi:hypothetical protein
MFEVNFRQGGFTATWNLRSHLAHRGILRNDLKCMSVGGALIAEIIDGKAVCSWLLE